MLTKQCIEGNPRKESLSGTPTQFRGFRRNYRSGTTTVRWAILIATFACLAQADLPRESRIQQLRNRFRAKSATAKAAAKSPRARRNGSRRAATNSSPLSVKPFIPFFSVTENNRKKATERREQEAKAAFNRHEKNKAARLLRKTEAAQAVCTRRKKFNAARIRRETDNAARKVEAKAAREKAEAAREKAEAARKTEAEKVKAARIRREKDNAAARKAAREKAKAAREAKAARILREKKEAARKAKAARMARKHRRLIERLVRAEVEMATSCD